MNRLKDLVKLGLETEYEQKQEFNFSKVVDSDVNKKKFGIVTRFITTHKGSVRCVRFSKDGKFAATGSFDNSIKLLDTEKMHFNHLIRSENEDQNSARPVIRTFYDHTQTINDVCFHPTQPILFSASSDQSIKVFEWNKQTQKRSTKMFQESSPVRSVDVHPCGDYLLVATEHNILRLYDINTSVAYSTTSESDHHFSSIYQARFSADGKLYCSAGKEGSIKLWDGISGRCVNTFTNAHAGEVYSCQFSKNGKYLLSCGSDGKSKLWDLSIGKPLQVYSFKTKSKIFLNAVFNWNEECVISSDYTDVCVFNAKSGEVLQKAGGHNKVVRYVASSPTEGVVMSCSDDQRARFWVQKGTK
jgi:cleavage stimulation factor subunit 1